MGTPTNPQLQKLIEELKTAAAKEEAPIWKRVAVDLERPSRERRAVNLSRINRTTKANETVVVPGKVLSMGELDHSVTVAAAQFSGQARDKISKKGSAITITELMQKQPKGTNIRIIG
jgi:large subunit ribosomal protein L18e